MTTLYKLTDANGKTRCDGNELQWGVGVTHEAKGERRELCSDGLIHAYEHPLIAVVMNPVDANYKSARLWRCTTRCKLVRHDQTKCGVRKLTTVEEIPLPKITKAQRIRAAILVVWEVYEEPEWRAWATNWLSGKDRSEEAAWARARAAEVPAWAAAWAAWAAAWAAEARAAAAAAWAVAEADAIHYAAGNRPTLDILGIIERAIEEER